MRSVKRLQGGTWDVGLSLNKLRIMYLQIHTWTSQVVPVVENLPSSAEVIGMWIRSLGWEDPLEESMAMHSSILAWRFPWIEEPGRLWSMGMQRLRHDRSD